MEIGIAFAIIFYVVGAMYFTRVEWHRWCAVMDKDAQETRELYGPDSYSANRAYDNRTFNLFFSVLYGLLWPVITPGVWISRQWDGWFLTPGQKTQRAEASAQAAQKAYEASVAEAERLLSQKVIEIGSEVAARDSQRYVGNNSTVFDAIKLTHPDWTDEEVSAKIEKGKANAEFRKKYAARSERIQYSRNKHRLSAPPDKFPL